VTVSEGEESGDRDCSILLAQWQRRRQRTARLHSVSLQQGDVAYRGQLECSNVSLSPRRTTNACSWGCGRDRWVSGAETRHAAYIYHILVPRDLEAAMVSREGAAGVVPSEHCRFECVLRAHGRSSETLLPSTAMGEQAGQSSPHAPPPIHHHLPSHSHLSSDQGPEASSAAASRPHWEATHSASVNMLFSKTYYANIHIATSTSASSTITIFYPQPTQAIDVQSSRCPPSKCCYTTASASHPSCALAVSRGLMYKR
jgi:hypothetical protein